MILQGKLLKLNYNIIKIDVPFSFKESLMTSTQESGESPLTRYRDQDGYEVGKNHFFL